MSLTSIRLALKRHFALGYAVLALGTSAVVVPFGYHLATLETVVQSPLYDDLDYKPTHLAALALLLESHAAEVELGERSPSELAPVAKELRDAVRDFKHDARAQNSLVSVPNFPSIVIQLQAFCDATENQPLDTSRDGLERLRLTLGGMATDLRQLGKDAHALEMRANEARNHLLSENRRFLGTSFGLIWAAVLVVGWLALSRLRAQEKEMTAYRAMLVAEKNALNAALAAEIAQNTFLGKVSHEINSPLQTILTNVQLLEKRLGIGHACQPLIKRLTTSVSHLCGQVADLLGVSELKSGRLSLHPETIDLLPLFSDVVAVHQGSAELKGIRLQFSHGELGLAFADGRRLAQIVTNLVTNAIRYTDAGYVAVNVTLSSYGKRGKLTLRVKDSGVGMSSSARELLYQAFANTAESRQGTGLGLAIVKGLVDEMRGTVCCDSKLGEGTTFVVTLPLELRDERRAKPRTVPDAQACLAALRPTAPVRLLFVEDDPDIRDTMGDMLTEGGYDVDIVSTVADAQAALNQCEYVAILADMELPDGSGLDIARFAKTSLNEHTPLIAVTAYAATLRKDGMDIFDERLRKPLDIAALYTVLQRITRPKAVA
jgi:signal transduction histidine kinase